MGERANFRRGGVRASDGGGGHRYRCGDGYGPQSLAAGASRGHRGRQRSDVLMVCQGIGGQGLHGVVTGSRIYRFRVAGSGRIGGDSLVRGRTLAGLRAHELAVAADGSEVAVTTGPPAATGAAGSAEIMVIHTRTGARAVWHNAPAVPGQMAFGVGHWSLTADGRELALLGSRFCVPSPAVAEDPSRAPILRLATLPLHPSAWAQVPAVFASRSASLSIGVADLRIRSAPCALFAS